MSTIKEINDKLEREDSVRAYIRLFMLMLLPVAIMLFIAMKFLNAKEISDNFHETQKYSRAEATEICEKNGLHLYLNNQRDAFAFSHFSCSNTPQEDVLSWKDENPSRIIWEISKVDPSFSE